MHDKRNMTRAVALKLNRNLVLTEFESKVAGRVTKVGRCRDARGGSLFSYCHDKKSSRSYKRFLCYLRCIMGREDARSLFPDWDMHVSRRGCFPQ